MDPPRAREERPLTARRAIPAGEALAAAVEAALAAADIPRSKLGATRTARLSAGERTLYRWILRRFADRGRPSRTDLGAAAAPLGVDASSALAALAREDLVHVGQDDEIAVAYPFSGRPTGHRVRFQSGHEAYAMCAIDALGTASMFEQPVAIASTDPVGGESIHVEVEPDDRARWSPESAVVVAAAFGSGADACGSCCPAVNFFASPANASRWLAAHDVRGQVISMPEAVRAGRAVFGDALKDA